MITIKQRNDKWRVGLEKEIWEVNSVEELKFLIEEICKLKNKYGKISADECNW